MSWAPNTGTTGWTHSGTTKDVWVFSNQQAGTGAIVAQIADVSLAVGIFLYGSPLADSRWEVIPTSGTGGNIVIRKWTLGTPASAAAFAAHGLTDAEPYTIQVRWVAGKISVFLNNSSTAVVEYDTNSDTGVSLAANTAVGFFSETDGAMVGSFALYTLERTFSTLADVAWWVAGGSLYASDSGRGGAKLIGSFFDPSARIVSAEGNQHAYIFDGSKCVDLDSVAMTAGLIDIDAGTMPGQSALNTPPGATTAIAAAYNYDRLILASGNNLTGSAIGFAQPDKDFDLTSTDLGKAFVLPAKSGQPLIALFSQDRNRLVYTSRRATWELTADPIIGGDVGQLSGNLGATGPYSGLFVEGGRLIMHTNEGMVVIPTGGGINHLSREVLTDIIQPAPVAGIPFTDLLTISMVQDTQRHGIWVFLTPIDGVSAGRHLFYDIRLGAFSPGALGGGWFPIDFASVEIQPTCCMEYLGEVVFGTQDGRMLFMDAAATDDCGDPFTTKITVNLMRDPDQEHGVLLRTLELVMGLNSAESDIKVFGGETPERAFLDPFTVYTARMNYPRNSFTVSGSAGALVAQIQSTGRIALENVVIDAQPVPIITTRKRSALAPSAPCQPPTPATPTTPDDTGEGPGGDDTPPDPETCTACATWMDANKTHSVGGDDAYRLAGYNTLAGAQAELTSALAAFLSANICDLPEASDDINVYVESEDPAFLDGPVMTIGDFLALDPGDYDEEDKTWRVSFRCDDIA